MPDKEVVEEVTMSEDLKAELNHIARFLATHDDGRHLWDVLTALRGPDYSADECNMELMDRKAATTAVIRYQLGLRDGYFGAIVNPDSDAFAAIRNCMSGWSHHKHHTQRAFEALGLNWHINNHPDTKQPVRTLRATAVGPVTFKHISADAAIA